MVERPSDNHAASCHACDTSVAGTVHDDLRGNVAEDSVSAKTDPLYAMIFQIDSDNKSLIGKIQSDLISLPFIEFHPLRNGQSLDRKGGVVIFQDLRRIGRRRRSFRGEVDAAECGLSTHRDLFFHAEGFEAECRCTESGLRSGGSETDDNGIVGVLEIRTGFHPAEHPFLNYADLHCSPSSNAVTGSLYCAEGIQSIPSSVVR